MVAASTSRVGRSSRRGAGRLAPERPHEPLGREAALLALGLMDAREPLAGGRRAVEADDREVAGYGEPAVAGGELGAERQRIAEGEQAR